MPKLALLLGLLAATQPCRAFRAPACRAFRAPPLAATLDSSAEVDSLPRAPLPRPVPEEQLQQLLAVFAVVESDPQSPPPEPLHEATAALLDAELFSQALRMRRARAELLPEEGQREATRKQVELAHVFLSGFASHARQKRAQSNVREMLRCAVEGDVELDACLQQLEASGQLDTGLLTYATSLVQAEARKCGVEPPPIPAALMQAATGQSGSQQPPAFASPDFDSVTSVAGTGADGPSPLLQILTIVRNRIVAEKATASSTATTAADDGQLGPGDNPHIPTLARAIRLDDVDQREKFLRSALPDRKAARLFAEFAEKAAQFLIQKVEAESRLSLLDERGDPADADGPTQAQILSRDLREQQRGQVRQADAVREVAKQVRAMIERSLTLPSTESGL